MGLFLFRFWPVLLPLAIYLIWYWRAGRKAVKEGQPRPGFRDGPWYWLVLSSLLIGVGCFLILGLSMEGGKGVYIPSHMEQGKLVPGQVKQAP